MAYVKESCNQYPLRPPPRIYVVGCIAKDMIRVTACRFFTSERHYWIDLEEVKIHCGRTDGRAVLSLAVKDMPGKETSVDFLYVGNKELTAFNILLRSIKDIIILSASFRNLCR